MNKLTKLLNIGLVLSDKLSEIGIEDKKDLLEIGSESTFLQIASLPNSGACINMLYALEGAILGVRWHNLHIERKNELLDFFNSLEIS